MYLGGLFLEYTNVLWVTEKYFWQRSKRLQAEIQNKGLYFKSKTWRMLILHPIIQYIIKNVLLSENGTIWVPLTLMKKETWAAYKTHQTCTKECVHVPHGMRSSYWLKKLLFTQPDYMLMTKKRLFCLIKCTMILHNLASQTGVWVKLLRMCGGMVS